MPPRNDHDVRRLEEYDRRTLDSIDLLFKELEKVKISQAIMTTKLTIYSSLCGLGTGVAFRIAEHFWK